MVRNVEKGRAAPVSPASARSVIAVIGVNEYAAWPRLSNAVNDALAVRDTFIRLGFSEIAAPLINASASSRAIHELIVDDLSKLGSNDSLVVFFAGHGHNHTIQLTDASVRTGYLVPSDAEGLGGRVTTWIRLDSWLSDIARLPAKHILVILDACSSGIALGSLVKWRSAIPPPIQGLATLQARRSRRIITSALGDQVAMDSGPFPNHSLFTGCLLEALRGGLAVAGRRFTTGSQLGAYLQQRVSSYPASGQTPDFGALELDDRGELVLPILEKHSSESTASVSVDVTRASGPRNLLPLGLISLLMGSSLVSKPASSPPKGDDTQTDKIGKNELSSAGEAVPKKSSPLQLLLLNPLTQHETLSILDHVVTCAEAASLPQGDPDGMQPSVTCGSEGLAQIRRYEEAVQFCNLIGARLPTREECRMLASKNSKESIWSASIQRRGEIDLVYICNSDASDMYIVSGRRPLNIGVRCVK